MDSFSGNVNMKIDRKDLKQKGGTLTWKAHGGLTSPQVHRSSSSIIACELDFFAKALDFGTLERSQKVHHERRSKN